MVSYQKSFQSNSSDPIQINPFRRLLEQQLSQQLNSMMLQKDNHQNKLKPCNIGIDQTEITPIFLTMPQVQIPQGFRIRQDRLKNLDEFFQQFTGGSGTMFQTVKHLLENGLLKLQQSRKNQHADRSDSKDMRFVEQSAQSITEQLLKMEPCGHSGTAAFAKNLPSLQSSFSISSPEQSYLQYIPQNPNKNHNLPQNLSCKQSFLNQKHQNVKSLNQIYNQFYTILSNCNKDIYEILVLSLNQSKFKKEQCDKCKQDQHGSLDELWQRCVNIESQKYISFEQENEMIIFKKIVEYMANVTILHKKFLHCVNEYQQMQCPVVDRINQQQQYSDQSEQDIVTGTYPDKLVYPITSASKKIQSLEETSKVEIIPPPKSHNCEQKSFLTVPPSLLLVSLTSQTSQSSSKCSLLTSKMLQSQQSRKLKKSVSTCLREYRIQNHPQKLEKDRVKVSQRGSARIEKCEGSQLYKILLKEASLKENIKENGEYSHQKKGINELRGTKGKNIEIKASLKNQEGCSQCTIF